MSFGYRERMSETYSAFHIRWDAVQHLRNLFKLRIIGSHFAGGENSIEEAFNAVWAKELFCEELGASFAGMNRWGRQCR